MTATTTVTVRLTAEELARPLPGADLPGGFVWATDEPGEAYSADHCSEMDLYDTPMETLADLVAFAAEHCDLTGEVEIVLDTDPAYAGVVVFGTGQDDDGNEHDAAVGFSFEPGQEIEPVTMMPGRPAAARG